MVAAFIVACDPASSPTTDTTTTVPPTPISGIIPNPEDCEGSGAVRIVSAEPPPGTRIGGCGPEVKGCAGRIRLVFRVTSPGSGWVQYVSAYLYGTENTIACL